MIFSTNHSLSNEEIYYGRHPAAAYRQPVRPTYFQPELVSAIDEYVTHHNTDPKPFIWTKSARDILQKVIRANSRLSSKQNGTLH